MTASGKLVCAIAMCRRGEEESCHPSILHACGLEFTGRTYADDPQMNLARRSWPYTILVRGSPEETAAKSKVREPTGHAPFTDDNSSPETRRRHSSG